MGEGPVAAFCAGLNDLRRASGRSPAALAQALNISRGHLYAILNGEVKRPPDWSRTVEPFVRACGADRAAVAEWRRRHEVLEQVYEELRRWERAAAADLSAAKPPAEPPAQPPAAEPVAAKPKPVAAEPELIAAVSPEPVAPKPELIAAEPKAADLVTPEPESVAADSPEPVAAVSVEREPVAAVSPEPELIAPVSPEPVAPKPKLVAADSAEPEPEAVAADLVAAEPEPVAAVSPEPVAAVSAKREPEAVAADLVAPEPEPVSAASPEPVAAVSAKREPVAVAPEPVAVSPEPVAVAAEPEPVAVAPESWSKALIAGVVGIVAAMLVAGAVLVAAIVGSDKPDKTDAAGPAHPPCARATPPAGSDLLDVGPGAADPGNPRFNPWWGNDDRITVLTFADRHNVEAAVRMGTTNPWDLVLVHSCVPQVSGQRYSLSFTASADVAATVRVRVQDRTPPAYVASVERTVDLTPTPRRLSVDFVGAVTTPSAELMFQVGGGPDFVMRITDITLVAGGA